MRVRILTRSDTSYIPVKVIISAADNQFYIPLKATITSDYNDSMRFRILALLGSNWVGKSYIQSISNILDITPSYIQTVEERDREATFSWKLPVAPSAPIRLIAEIGQCITNWIGNGGNPPATGTIITAESAVPTTSFHFEVNFNPENVMQRATIVDLIAGTDFVYAIRHRTLYSPVVTSDYVVINLSTMISTEIDIIAPKMPTNLISTAEVYFDRLRQYRSRLNYSWDKVTQNIDNSPIVDLSYYELQVFEVDRFNQLLNATLMPGVYTSQPFDNALPDVYGRYISMYTSVSSHTMIISGHRLGGLIVSNNIPVTNTHHSISESVFADIDKYSTTIAMGTTISVTSAKQFAIINITAGADLNSDTESYSFPNAQPNVIYLARVRAIDISDNKSPWTLINNIRGAVDTAAPATPTNIIAAATYHSVNVRWDRNIEEDLAGYELQRDVDGGGWITVGHLVSNFYVDADVVPSSIYKYKVRAYDHADNYSNWSIDSNSVSLLDLVDTSIIMDIINDMTTINLLKNSSYEAYNLSTLVPRHWTPVAYNQSTYTIQSIESPNVDIGGAYSLLLHKKEATSGWVGVMQALTRIIGAGQTQTTRSTVCTITNTTTYALHTKIYRSSTVSNNNFVSLLLMTQSGVDPPHTEFVKTVQLSSCPVLQWYQIIATGYVNSASVIDKAWAKILYGGPTGGIGPGYKLYVDNTMLQKGTKTQWVPYSDEFIFGDYAITEVEITNDAVIAPKIMANAVLAKHIRAGAIGANHIVVQNRHCELEGRFLADRQAKDLDRTSDDAGPIFRAGNIGMVGTGFKTITDIYSDQMSGGYVFLVDDASGITTGDFVIINYLSPSEQPNDTFLTLNSQFAEVSVSDGGVLPGQITLYNPLELSVETDMHVVVVNAINAYIAESDGIADENGWAGSYKTIQIPPTNFIIVPPTTESYIRRWIKLVDNLNGTGTITLENDVYANFNQDSLLIGSIDIYNQGQFPERISSIRLIGGIGTTINGSQIDTYSINAVHLQSDSIDVRHLQAGIVQAQHLDIGGFVPNDRAIVSYHFDTNVLPSNRIDGMLSFDQAQSSANWLIMYKDNTAKFDGYLKLGNVVTNMMTITDSVFGSTSNWITYTSLGSAIFTKGVANIPHGISTYYKYERQYNTVGKIVLGGVATYTYVISPEYNVTAGNYYTSTIAIRTADLTGVITGPESYAALLLVWYDAGGSQISFIIDYAEQVGDWQILTSGGQAPVGCTKVTVQVLVANAAGPSYDNIVYFTHAWLGETTSITYDREQIYSFPNTDIGPVYLVYSGLTNTIRPKEGSISFWGKLHFSGTGSDVGGFIDIGNTSYGSGGASNKIGLYFIKRAIAPKWNLVFMNGLSSITVTEADTTLNPWMVTSIWTHVVATWKENDYLRLYINGNLLAEKAISTLASNQWYSDNLLLGAMDSSLTSNINLDELLLYDYQIDAEEVKALYYANSAGPHRNTSIDADAIRTGALYSVDYRPNFSGWIVDFNGDVEFNSGTFRGSVVIEGGATIRNGATIEGTAVVDGDALIDGTVTTSKVVAGAISADKMSIGMNNLLPNGSFEAYSGPSKRLAHWTMIPAGTGTVSVAATGVTIPHGGAVGRIHGDGTNISMLLIDVPVDYDCGHDSITLSGQIRIQSGGSGTPSYRIAFLGSAKNVLKNFSIINSDIGILDQWQRFAYSGSFNDYGTPANIRYARVILRNVSTYTCFYDMMKLEYTNAISGSQSLTWASPYSDNNGTYIDARGIRTGAVESTDGNMRVDLDDAYIRIISGPNDITTFDSLGNIRSYYNVEFEQPSRFYTVTKLIPGSTAIVLGSPTNSRAWYESTITTILDSGWDTDTPFVKVKGYDAFLMGIVTIDAPGGNSRRFYRRILPQTDYSYSGGVPAVLDKPFTGNGRTDLESVLVGNSSSPEFNLYTQYVWDPTNSPYYDEDKFSWVADGYVPRFGDGVYDRTFFNYICETYLVTMIEISYT